MDKKKITAGSVDELMEIVRAVQRGEDPDINKIREDQRRKREEEILERRRKRSQGSADSAGPVRASGKKPKEEKSRKQDREEEQEQKENSKPAGEDAQEEKGEVKEQEPEAAADDFSWPQFDPRKMLAERNAESGGEKASRAEGGTPASGEEPDEKDVSAGDEEPDEEEHLGILDRLWGRRGMEPEEDDEDEEEPEEPEDDSPDEERSDDKESPEDEEDFDDDEFERLLDEDNTEEEFIKGRETMTAFTAKAAELLGGLRQKAGGAAARSREKSRKKPEGFDGFVDLEDADQKEKTGADSAGNAERKAGIKSPDRNQGFDRDRMRRLEQSLSRRYSDDEDSEEDFTHREAQAKADVRTETGAGALDKADEEEPEVRSDAAPAEGRKWERLSPKSGNRQKEDGYTSSENSDSLNGRRNRGSSDRDADREPDSRKSGQKRSASGKERSRRSSERERGSREPERSRRASGRQAGGKIQLPAGMARMLRTARTRLRDGWNSLNQRGIHKREMAMLVIVLLFALLILFFIINAVQNFFSQRQKSRNVTAEEGLIVTVEDEPREWAASYPVKLKILSRKGTVSSVTVNGVSCTPDETGVVTLETGEWSLQAQVTTDDGVKTAEIEIPMLDGVPPVLDIKREDGMIVLSAADARSQVEGIYYAVEDPGGYRQLPSYQKYQDPVKYEDGMTYRFFAKDKAGNVSTPVVTTLEDAESFELEQTGVSLFPGGTCSLNVETAPAGALLRNLKFESTDTSVATVEENGKITAVGEGTAEIHVSAEGMESQTCTVTVSEERTVLVSTIGDCTLGTDESFNTSTSFNAFDSVNGHDYFFRNVKDILENDDVTFANFEGTLTDSTAREAKQFAFKGDPSYAEILKDGSVEVVTLANNHSRDYGEQSLEDTKAALTAADIDYCVGDEIVIREVNGVKMAFIGIYVLDIGLEVQSQVVETITQARQQLGAELVIVAFHWGSEKATTPDETQRTLAHTAIDRGADLVVGHHPHVLQGIEQYNGKYIVYSLANFCFGGNSAPSDMDTMIFQQSFKVSRDGEVENGEISIIPCSISSESGYNNYQPTPASGSEAERIIGRLNEYSQEFGQTYTAAER